VRPADQNRRRGSHPGADCGPSGSGLTFAAIWPARIDQRSQSGTRLTHRRCRSALGVSNPPRPPPTPWTRPDLIFFNGFGWILPRTAVSTLITTAPGRVTPAPWVNVLANPQFGTVLSEKRRRLHLGRETRANSV